MRVVVDTNVLVSAILSPSGPPAKIIDLILSQRVTLLVSPSILAEYAEVLKRKEFFFGEESVNTFLRVIARMAEKVNSDSHSTPLPDPDDQSFLACAVAGNADFLITGNKKHFPEAACRPIKAVSPSEFLANLSKLELI